MKKILGTLALAFVLSVSVNSNVNAIGADAALALAKKAEGYVGQLKTYLSSKNYGDIKSNNAKTAVKGFCQKGCGRFTCGKTGVKKQVGAACKKLCPSNDVKNCVKKM